MNIKMKRITALLLSALLCFCALQGTMQVRAASRIGVVTADELRVRTAAGTQASILGYLNTGATVAILGETTVGTTIWYNITCNVASGMVTGWSSGDYIREIDLDSDYDTYLSSQGFPQSYWDALKGLHALYPNWVFVAVDTGLEWSDVVANETKLGRNLIHRSNPSYYINTSDVDSSGNQIGRDGYYWVAASPGIVKYYLDPRNFLSDPYIFMFESLSYDVTNHTAAGVEKILNNTFMDEVYTFTADGGTYTHAQAIMEAAKVSGVSPFHIASRLRQEQGTTGSVLSDGSVSGYSGYYNYFNYGAYTTTTNSAVVNGAIYASKVSADYFGPWTNPLRSIKGGAKMLGESYINKGQDTVYFQKFNVVYKASLYTHQYMTNVSVGATESQTLRNAYDSESIQGSLVFKIPVYKNMPASAVPKPTAASPDPSNPVNPPTPTEPDPPVTPSTTVSSSAYVIRSGGWMSAINLGAQVSEFLSKVSVSNGSKRVITAAGNVKSSGTMMTGDRLQVLNNSGGVVAAYTVVIWGDVSGDGKITLVDLLKVQRQIIGSSALSGCYSTAGDINGDGKISLIDLLSVQRHIIGKATIAQTR